MLLRALDQLVWEYDLGCTISEERRGQSVAFSILCEEKRLVGPKLLFGMTKIVNVVLATL